MRMLIATLLFLAIGTAVVSSSDHPIIVSIIALIGNPEKFDGKRIIVVGFLSLEFESDILYLSREDSERGIPKNGLWVERTKQMIRNIEQLDGRYVVIEGIFSSERKGHMSITSGGIFQVIRCEPWIELKKLPHRTPGSSLRKPPTTP